MASRQLSVNKFYKSKYLPKYCDINISESETETIGVLNTLNELYFAEETAKASDQASQDDIDLHLVLTDSDESDPETENRARKLPVEYKNTDIEWREEDKSEFEKVKKFRLVGCGCTRIYGKPCCDRIGKDVLEAARLTMQELDKNQMDLCLMAEMQQQMLLSDTVKRGSVRERQSVKFFHRGQEICLNAFLFIHDISESRYRRVRQHYVENGLTPRQHKLAGKPPPNACAMHDELQIKTFIQVTEITM